MAVLGSDKLIRCVDLSISQRWQHTSCPNSNLTRKWGASSYVYLSRAPPSWRPNNSVKANTFQDQDGSTIKDRTGPKTISPTNILIKANTIRQKDINMERPLTQERTAISAHWNTPLKGIMASYTWSPCTLYIIHYVSSPARQLVSTSARQLVKNNPRGDTLAQPLTKRKPGASARP